MNDDLLRDIGLTLFQLEDQNEAFYKTVDFLKKAAKQNAPAPTSKPLPSILDAIGEANWTQYQHTRSKLWDMRNKIREALND